MLARFMTWWRKVFCHHDWQPTGKTWTELRFVGKPSAFTASDDMTIEEERCIKCGSFRTVEHW